MGKIYLIRHGETEANKTFQFQGHIDNPLNSKGLCQAAALGQHYENIVLDEIYSSSMQRARQTASIKAVLCFCFSVHLSADLKSRPCSEPDRLQHLWLKLMDLLFSL